MGKRVLEICVDSVHSAVIAQNGGADRIELCQLLEAGGITPSKRLYEHVRKIIEIPLFVLVRPRHGDFIYSKQEIELMKSDIRFAMENGADGIVSGVLLASGSIDFDVTSELVEFASPLPFTFHRAFDVSLKRDEDIQKLATLGVRRILTSGGAETAVEGIENLSRYVKLAGHQVTILAAGRIRSENVESILKVGGLVEFHSSARNHDKIKSKEQPIMQTLDISSQGQTTMEEVKLLREKLDE